ncbi:hypothetical protein ACE6H2_012108 [Prunus campanulata]
MATNFLAIHAFTVQSIQSGGEGQAMGPRELRSYLRALGYLNDDGLEDLNITVGYDELLESALKIFRINYHLNVTGTLDSETMDPITTPRCGVADLVNANEVGLGSPADLRISFQWRDHGDGSLFDGPDKVLAHDFGPTNGRLHVDA